MDKIILGFSGKKASGKNFCADLIKETLSPESKVELLALADPIKEIAINYFGISREVCYGTNEQKNSTLTDWYWEEIPGNHIALDKYGKMSVREILQYIGTDLFRKHMHEDFWIKSALNKIKKSDSDISIITDVRFPNEVKLIREAGGTIIRIMSKFADVNDNHPSETALDKIDRLTMQYKIVSECKDNFTGDNISLQKVINNLYYNYILFNDMRDRGMLKDILKDLLLDMSTED